MLSGLILSSPASAASEDRLEIYHIRNSVSGLLLEANDLGSKRVQATTNTGPIAQWERIDLADGSVQLRNMVTQTVLTQKKPNNKNIELALSPTSGSAWSIVPADGGIQLVNAVSNRLLTADGKNKSRNGKPDSVSLATSPTQLSTWLLEPIAPSSTRTVEIQNVRTGRYLATVSASLGAEVIASPSQNALARWQYLELADGEFLLRNVATGEFLEARNKKNGYNVATTPAPDKGDSWSQEGEPGAISLKSNKRFLSIEGEADGFNAATTKRSEDLWVLADVESEGLCTRNDSKLAVNSHADGDIVDVGPTGTQTGSFRMSGTSAVGTTSVTVEVGTESVSVDLDPQSCVSEWSLEITPPDAGPADFLVASADGAGDTQQIVLTLEVITAAEDDTLVTPEYLATPDISADLETFDEISGAMTISGDPVQQLAVGQVLVAEPIPGVAPNGYLRVIEAISIDDNGNAVLETRQGSIAEVVRQIDINETISFDSEEPTDEDVGVPVLAQRLSSRNIDRQTFVLEVEAVVVAAYLSARFEVTPSATFRLDIDYSVASFLTASTPELKELYLDFKVDYRAEGEIGAQRPVAGLGVSTDPKKKIKTPLSIGIVPGLRIGFEIVISPRIEVDVIAQVAVPFIVSSGSESVGFRYSEGANDNGIFRDSVAPTVDLIPEFGSLEGSITGSLFAGVEAKLEGSILEGSVKVIAAGVRTGPKYEYGIEVTSGPSENTGVVKQTLSIARIPFAEVKLKVWKFTLLKFEPVRLESKVVLFERDRDISDQLANIATASLPPGRAGIPYPDTQLEGTGTGPLEWEAIQLPPGLSLSADGLLSGTPTVAGTQTAEIRVNSPNRSRRTETFPIAIADPPPPGDGALKWVGNDLIVESVNADIIESATLVVSTTRYTARTSDPRCSGSGTTTTTCQITTIMPGSPQRISFELPRRDLDYTVTATLDSPTDPELSNNQAGVTVSALDQPDAGVQWSNSTARVFTANGASFGPATLVVSWVDTGTGSDDRVEYIGGGSRCTGPTRGGGRWAFTCAVNAVTPATAAEFAFNFNAQTTAFTVSATIQDVANESGPASNSATKTVDAVVISAPDRAVRWRPDRRTVEVYSANGVGFEGSSLRLSWDGSFSAVSIPDSFGCSEAVAISSTGFYEIACISQRTYSSTTVESYQFTIDGSATRVAASLAPASDDPNVDNNFRSRPS